MAKNEYSVTVELSVSELALLIDALNLQRTDLVTNNQPLSDDNIMRACDNIILRHKFEKELPDGCDT